MSNRTSPTRNDILVSGCASDGTFYIKFMDIENPDVLEEFNRFGGIAVVEFPTLPELVSYLDAWYQKPEGWFLDSFINNAFMGALDTISKNLCNKCFCEWHDQKTIDGLAVRVLMWVAFLAKKYGTKEEPEIYSELLA